MITEKEKTIIIQTFEPYELHQLGVFKNNTKSIGILYSFQKPCGWDFATLWDDLEEKLNKKIEFVEIESIRCADPLYQQEILENQHIFYSNGSQEISQNSEFCRF